MVAHMNLTRRTLVVAGSAVLVAAATGAALAAATSGPRGPHVVSLAADGRSSATLEVVTGTPVLNVTVANLGGTGGTLLRATTPAAAPPSQLTATWGDSRDRSGQKDLVLLSVSSGTTPITVTLNAAVNWRLDFAGGTDRTVADLRGGDVSAVTFTAGSDIIDLSLPRPRGMVPVRLAGGASQFHLSLPGGVPVRVTAAGGAGEVTVDGASYSGVAGGSVYATRGWSASVAGFDIQATAGAALLSVGRWSQ